MEIEIVPDVYFLKGNTSNLFVIKYVQQRSDSKREFMALNLRRLVESMPNLTPPVLV